MKKIKLYFKYIVYNMLKIENIYKNCQDKFLKTNKVLNF